MPSVPKPTTLFLAPLLVPLALTAQSARPATPAPIQCDTLATPESGLVEMVAIGPDGAVAWTDGPRATSVQLLRPGKAAQSVSRNGAGPGELRLVTAMGWRADTLWVTDGRLHRLSGFAAGEEFLRAIPLASRGAFVARDDTSFIGSIVPAPEMGADVGVAPPTIGVVVPRSGQTLSFVSLPVVPMANLNVLPSLQPVSRVAANRDGSRWCATANGADGATQLACVTNGGRVLFEGMLALAPRAVPEAVVTDEVAAFARSMGAPPSAVTSQFTVPRSTTAAFELLVNGSTEVWLARSRPADLVAVWDRVAFDGTMLTPKSLPGKYQLRAIDGDDFYAAETDGDGVQALVRCRVGGGGK